jgi:hypothetical protein
MQTEVVRIENLGISYPEAHAAFGRVYDSRVQSPGEPIDPEMDFDRDVHEQWICRLISQGRVVRRLRETEGGRHSVHLSLIAHPSLPEGQFYAVRHCQHNGYGNVYQCNEQDAAHALAYPSVFNL